MAGRGPAECVSAFGTFRGHPPFLAVQIRAPNGKISRCAVQVLPSVVSVNEGWVSGVVIDRLPVGCPVAGDFFMAAISEGGLLHGSYLADDPNDGEWASFEWRPTPTTLEMEGGHQVMFCPIGAYWTDGWEIYPAAVNGAPLELPAPASAVDEPWPKLCEIPGDARRMSP